jgi:hypothetical protein
VLPSISLWPAFCVFRGHFNRTDVFPQLLSVSHVCHLWPGGAGEATRRVSSEGPRISSHVSGS